MNTEDLQRLADEDLMPLVARKNPDAFEVFYDRHGGAAYSLAHRIVGDPGLAEDVTQEAFLSALRRLRETQSEIAFKPWIYRIARNQAIDSHRRSIRAEEISMDAEAKVASGDYVRGGKNPDRLGR